MFRKIFNRAALLLVVLCIAACSQKSPLPYYNTADFTPLFLSKKEAAEKITHTIEAFSFINQEGKTIGLKNVEGKIHVANFFFTSCGSICPAITDNLHKANAAFGGDTNIVFLSFSVMPWKDSVSRLKEYAETHEIKANNWHLLTGSKSAIYRLARQSYFAEENLGYNKDSTDFLHTEHIILIDGDKRIRGIYNGTLPLEIEQLTKDIRTLKEE